MDKQNYTDVFERTEIKYILTPQQKSAILEAMKPYMLLDKYKRTTIRNIYYDTDDFRLIRTSLDKPVYKEKLRVRSYCQVNDNDDVFVEIKKKYDGVVYKRRITMKKDIAGNFLASKCPSPKHSQIVNELEYFIKYYKTLSPKVFLSYEREAYYTISESDFRITFDENILYRQTELDLSKEVYGSPLLDKDLTLMEVKTSGGMPLWLTKVLTENTINKTSYSKYGEAYKKISSAKTPITIALPFAQFKGGVKYA